MIRKEKVFICDKCGEKAFPVLRTSFLLRTYGETIPDDWTTLKQPFGKLKHLCDRCTKEYRRYKQFMEQKEEKDGYQGLG